MLHLKEHADGHMQRERIPPRNGAADRDRTFTSLPTTGRASFPRPHPHSNVLAASPTFEAHGECLRQLSWPAAGQAYCNSRGRRRTTRVPLANAQQNCVAGTQVTVSPSVAGAVRVPQIVVEPSYNTGHPLLSWFDLRPHQAKAPRRTRQAFFFGRRTVSRSGAERPRESPKPQSPCMAAKKVVFFNFCA